MVDDDGFPVLSDAGEFVVFVPELLEYVEIEAPSDAVNNWDESARAAIPQRTRIVRSDNL